MMDGTCLSEKIEADNIEDAEQQAREKYKSGLIEITNSAGLVIADRYAKSSGIDEIIHARLSSQMGGQMRQRTRILVPSHQIIEIIVSTEPLIQEWDLSKMPR